MPSKKSKSFSQREIATSISNAMVNASRPARLGEIEQKKLRRIREFTNALSLTLTEYIEEDLLEPEELVLSLLGAAMFIQTVAVMKSETPIQTAATKAVWGEDAQNERPKNE